MVKWSNWGGTYSCRPLSLTKAASEADIIQVIERASAEDQNVRVVGSGHSFSDAVCTEGHLLSLQDHDRVLEIDRESGLVTVEAGITIEDLNVILWANGLAMENLGDIGYQSVAGAISTATHGTGLKLGNISTQIRAIRLILADGSTLDCSPADEPEIFAAAQVSVGALGVISRVTIQCVPAFTLDGRVEPRPLDDLLENIDELTDANDHFEFFWFPHTEVAQVKMNNRTKEKEDPPSSFSQWFDKVFVENHVLGALFRVGKLRPSWIPALSRGIAKGIGRRHVVDRSYRVFTSPRLVRFSEMEYAIPRVHSVEALRKLRDFISDEGLLINFPVEVRFVAADDIPLSPSFSRETCYIAVHTFKGMDYRPYFEGVESIMEPLGGRPHWGKLHFRTAETLKPQYPKWSSFQKIRNTLDPDGRFANAYVGRVMDGSTP